jgi:RNA polymerase sigma-70 factor (ECF subfamily)
VSRSELWQAVIAERERAERVARSRCSSRQDAEDCVQEAMVRVVAMSDVDVARVGPLLSTVVANLAADTHRSRSRAARAEPRLRPAAISQPSPEEDVCDALEARWLWDKRAELPDQDRAVLELRTQGRTAGEAAAALGVTYKAAESAYTRARTKMRAIWRAAAALLGILWGRPGRDAAPVVVPAAASAALAVLTVLTVLATVVPAGEGRAEPRPPDRHPRVAVTAQAATEPAEPAAQTVPRPPRAVEPPPETKQATPPAASDEDPAPVVGLPAPTAGPVYAPAVGVGQERPEESMAETVERCLREGLIVTPTHVDCAG